MQEKYLDVIQFQEEITNYLVDVVGISEDVIEYAFGVQGINEDTLNDLLYYYSAYHDIYQYVEYEDPDKLYEEYGLELFEEDDEDEEDDEEDE